MRHWLCVVFLMAAVTACTEVDLKNQEQATGSLEAIPAAMIGCWESISVQRDREWLEIGPTLVRGKFDGESVFQTSRLDVLGPTPNGITRSLRIIVVTNSPDIEHVYEFWMEQPDILRIGGYWDEPEPDPYFSRCRTSDKD